VIVTPYFAFVHVPKTGGMWVKSVIPPEWEVERLRTHERRANIPERYAHLPVLAFVRNPWDWYVSLYSHRLHREWGPRHQVLFSNGTSFEAFLRTALTSDRFPMTGARRIADEGIDYYTVVFGNLTRPQKGVWFGRFERLRDDFLRFLETSGAPVGEELRAKVLEAPPENTSEHRAYRSYYTDELRELVAERSRTMIEQFGYSF